MSDYRKEVEDIVDDIVMLSGSITNVFYKEKIDRIINTILDAAKEGGD